MHANFQCAKIIVVIGVREYEKPLRYQEIFGPAHLLPLICSYITHIWIHWLLPLLTWLLMRLLRMPISHHQFLFNAKYC